MFFTVSTCLGDFLQAREELAGVPAVVAHVEGTAFARGVDAGARFDVGSLTKVVVTTTALMRLDVELGAPVRRWVPAFHGGAKDDVTVADLLAHVGGLWEWWPLYVRHADDPLGAAARLPLRYAPRTSPHYSDLGFMLLGQVVERESGLPLAQAAHALVLEPAGMRASGFGACDAVPSARGDAIERRMVETGEPYPVAEDAAAFAGWRTELVSGEPNDGNAHHAFGGVAGHAGLFATAADLARWAVALLGGELAPRARVDAHLAAVAGDRTLGLRRYDGGFVGHGGFPGAELRLSPRDGGIAVLLGNRLLAPGGTVALGPAADALAAHALGTVPCGA
jgi:serine-type D-Ala-D-Ala carboxypeptidase